MKRRFFVSLEQAILDVVRALPADKQQEVRKHASKPHFSPPGRDLGVMLQQL